MRVTEHFFLLFLLCRVVEISIAHVIVDDFVILEVPSMRFLMPTFRQHFLVRTKAQTLHIHCKLVLVLEM